MNIKVMNKDNTESGKLELPVQFSEDVRTDLIRRAVLAIQAANRQPYGGYGDAGMRHSSKLSRRRRDYRGSYGKGISRVPRKIHTRRGTQMNWVGALSPGTVGGRRAHPPKPYADFEQKINTAENRKAIRSAISATMQKETVATRGHKLPAAFPFIISNDFESFTKTAELEAALVKLGFADELVRGGNIQIRAGRGKSRGRKHKSPTSILFVVSKDATPLVKGAANLSGTDVISVSRLNAELLAPGAHPGRLTLYTQGAVERLAKELLFTQSYKGPGKNADAKTEAPAKKAKPVKSAPTEAKPAKEKPAAKKAPAKKKE